MSFRDFRKRVAESDALNEPIARALAAYVRFCHRTSTWERDGFDEMRTFLLRGEPVIVVLWHERLVMAPYLFELDAGKICSLTSRARAGRMAGRIQTKFGFETISMSRGQFRMTNTRDVLRKIRDGYSIGIAADGATGPPHVAKTFPIVWARSSGKPIFVVAYAGRHKFRLPTWDRMMMPLPWSSGVFLARRFDEDIPRKLDEAGIETLRGKLDQALNAVSDEADRRVQDRITSS